jgi:hypothetical protein
MMHRLSVTIILLAITVLNANAQRATDSIFVERALRQAPSGAGALHFARLFMGRPYIAHTLEVNDDEQLVVNTRQLDCTTLVENVVALTLCHQQKRGRFADFCEMLQRIRYRAGVINGYSSRLHYFTDWIIDNEKKGVVSEIQQKKAPFSAVQTVRVNYMSQHPQSYKALKAHPQLVSVIAEQEKTLTGLQFCYIPKSEIRNTKLLRSVIHDGDILAITTSKAGLDIAHLGFAVWRKDGLHLLNASQIHHKVVEEPMTFRKYLSKHPAHTGVRVVRLTP